MTKDLFRDNRMDERSSERTRYDVRAKQFFTFGVAVEERNE